MYEAIYRIDGELCSGGRVRPIEQIAAHIARNFTRTCCVFRLNVDQTMYLVVDDQPDVGWNQPQMQVIGWYQPDQLPDILTTYARMLT